MCSWANDGHTLPGGTPIPATWINDSGGERAAAMYSLIGTARLNGLDPDAYLAYVLERFADHPVDRADELPPWTMAPSRPSTAHVESIR